MKLKTLSLGLCLATVGLLDSCYFNSAGHIVDNASYDACAMTTDLKPGQSYVYTDGSKYYIELPRYRTGKPPYWQVSAWGVDKRKSDPRPTGETDMFEIPYDYVLYIADEANSPSTPSYMRKVNDPDKIKAQATNKIPVRYKSGSRTETYSYSSPNAAWWWVVGVFDWLCVDLPVSAAQTAATILPSFAWILLSNKAKHDRFASSYPCPECGGKGSWNESVQKYTTKTSPSGYTSTTDVWYDSELHTCSSCGGSGISAEGQEIMDKTPNSNPPWMLNF